MTKIEASPSNPSLAARWRQNRIDVEAGCPPTHALTPAQVARVKSTVGFPRGNGEARPSPEFGAQWGRSVMPISSHLAVAPGDVRDVGPSSMYSWFPLRVIFSQESLDEFEVEEVSLRRGMGGPVVLRSRDRGRIDVEAINRVVERVVVPPGAELVLRVRNVDDAPHSFTGAILCFSSASEQREHLLLNSYPRPGWWKPYHQSLVDLSGEGVRRIDAALLRCADGSQRRTWDQLCAHPGESR